MLRRLLVCWLLISIQGYGLALAADLHGQSHDQTAACAVTHQGDAGAAHASDGDHCNHGLFHLLGLPTMPLEGSNNLSCGVVTSVVPDPTLVFHPPRLRPPTFRFC